MLSPDFTIHVTQGKLLHVGESITNLALSEGDTLANPSNTTITELVGCSLYINKPIHKNESIRDFVGAFLSGFLYEGRSIHYLNPLIYMHACNC